MVTDRQNNVAGWRSPNYLHLYWWNLCALRITGFASEISRIVVHTERYNDWCYENEIVEAVE